MAETADSPQIREVRLAPRSIARIRHVPAAPPAPEPTPQTAFLDTDDGTLTRRGLTLSRAEGRDGDWMLTIPQGRQHWALELPHLRSAPARPPAALCAVLEGLTDGRPLQALPADAVPSDTAPDGRRPKRRQQKRSRQKTATGAEVLTTVLSAQVEALELWDLRTRLDLPDAVHQLRVTARSLRSLLKAAKPYLEQEPAERLGAQLQDLGRALSAARDAEVTAELLPERAASLQGLVGETTQDVVHRTAGRHASAAAATVRQAAGRPEHLEVLREARAFAQEPPLTKKAAKLSPQQMSDRLLRRALHRAAEEAARAATDAQQQELDPAQQQQRLHSVRKKAKRVRYVAKVLKTSGFRPSGPVRRMGKRARQAQDHLGAFLDDAVAAGWLEANRAELIRGGADAYELGLLHGAQIQRVHSGLDDGFRTVESLADEFGGTSG